MKIILSFLTALANFIVHAQPPSLTVEQTIRHIYRNYRSDVITPYFGETGERATISARTQQVLTLNDSPTPPGNISWLDYDPICDCQDFGDLAPESVAITQTDTDRIDAVMCFRIFGNDKEKIMQALKMVAENGRWVIDDIVSNHGSVLQVVNSGNEKTLTALASLQEEQSEALAAELFERIADYSWPWTWVVSDPCRQAVNIFYKTTSKTVNNPDEDMQTGWQSIYDNPICFGEGPLFSRVNRVRVLERTADPARIHVCFTLTNGNNEEQELVLQRREGKWEIADLIRLSSGSLLKQIEVKTTARLKQ